jgi:hypothetical protein
MARLRRALCRRLTEDHVDAIADKLIEMARDGNVSAAKLVLSYGIGKPTEAVTPDTLDLAEWDIHAGARCRWTTCAASSRAFPVEAVDPLVRVSKPYLNTNAMDTIMSIVNPSRSRS